VFACEDNMNHDDDDDDDNDSSNYPPHSDAACGRGPWAGRYMFANYTDLFFT